jgi:Histidine kinase/Histidine kinase-, DNA gyrase B-, and HSP90-like ATPase
MPAATPTFTKPTWGERFAPLVRAFHVYANWLVSISWKRFAVLSLLLLIISAILQDIPPFTWTISEKVETLPSKVVVAPPKPPKASKAPSPPEAPSAKDEPVIKIERPKNGGKESVEISIGEHGVRITPSTSPAAAAAAEAAASAAKAADDAQRAVREIEEKGVQIVVPAGASNEVKKAIEEARKDIREAIAGAKEDAEQAKRDAEEALHDAERVIEELQGGSSLRKRITRTSLGDALPNLAFLWIFCSAILKASYKRQLSAQAEAAVATEVAESEQLKRQVVEARMAAMQAQVEPHFLFNTLASIDHLIETDPPRASTMQKNLIALLRASMPTMREANHGAPRDLSREMAVIRPYLEILKVRMEERLSTRIDVPDGLLSAEFPPMMIQSLVENAIKHGLEPKAEGGEIKIKAEIVHGKLNIVVADTGLGFGKAATAGTGVGLANIRERLQLLYGNTASVTITENRPSGTVVTIAVPYRTVTPGAGA